MRKGEGGEFLWVCLHECQYYIEQPWELLAVIFLHPVQACTEGGWVVPWSQSMGDYTWKREALFFGTHTNRHEGNKCYDFVFMNETRNLGLGDRTPFLE
jgi:hypothetical protein